MSVQDIAPIMTAVQHAATLCQRVQSTYLTRLSKQGNEPVTIADYGAQAIICRAIHSVFPRDAIIAEESATGFKRTVKPEQQAVVAELVSEVLHETVSPADIITWLDYGQDTVSESTWIIDPIDGTRGFINDRHYIIAVGLVESGWAMGAVLGCPTLHDGELLVGWDGVAYRTPLFGEHDLTPFSVTRRGIGEKVYPVDAITAGRADNGVVKRIHETFQLQQPLYSSNVDAQMQIYVHIARGDADLFVCKPMTRCSPKVWDHAAGVALVEAAGGVVTDFEGRPIDFSRGDRIPNDSVAVSNGRIHPYVLDSIKVRPRFL